RVGDALAANPVVLDELHDRGRVDLGAADGVRLGVGGDHHERQPLAVAAAVVPGADRYRGGGADRGVLRRVVRPVDDVRGNVVVPAVRVIVGDDDRGR